MIMPGTKKPDNKKEKTHDTRRDGPPLFESPLWCHTDMEKGFMRIQELIDVHLNKIAESIDKQTAINETENGRDEIQTERTRSGSNGYSLRCCGCQNS